jgi:broad specificity phosphatase PhoE
MSEIYFVRHAQTSFERDKYDRLTGLGIKQAEILGDHFVRLGLDFHAVYSRSMARQKGTAKKVMPLLWDDKVKGELRIAAEFNEYDAHSVIASQAPQMIREDPSLSETLESIYTDRRAFELVFGRALLRWVSGEYDVPGVESWRAFKERICRGVNRVMEENGRKKRIAVFTSGGAISAVIQMALSLPDEETIRLSWQIHNTSVCTFKFSDKGFGLSSFNSVAHLELRREAELLTYR